MSAQPRQNADPDAGATLEGDGPLAEHVALLALAAPAAAAPSPDVKTRLLARVRESQAVEGPAPGWRFESMGAEAGWRGGRLPGVRFKTLSVDAARDVVLLLIEMAPGSRFPDHVHDAGVDEGIVIAGEVRTGGRVLRAGDYYFAAEGTTHADTVSASGCTALVSLTARAWEKWRARLALL